MSKRRSTPAEIETRVLENSARRCCLCFGLHGDYEVKPGQIAHLDNDPGNAVLDNLVFLCLQHHSEYDSQTSQHKNFTIREVKSYRDQLLKFVNKTRDHVESGSSKRSGDIGAIERISLLGILKRNQASEPLSQLLPETVAVANGLNLKALREFSSSEIKGYSDDLTNLPAYRLVQGVAFAGHLNPGAAPPGATAATIFDWLKSQRRDKRDSMPFIDDEVFPAAQPILEIEQLQTHGTSQSDATHLFTVTFKLKDIFPQLSLPNVPVTLVYSPQAWNHVVAGTRNKLNELLLLAIGS